MKAGTTDHELGTHVRITKIGDPCEEGDAILIGMTGTLTHPFPAFDGVDYMCGVCLDAPPNKAARQLCVNLLPEDTYEVIPPASRINYKVWVEIERCDPEGDCETLGLPDCLVDFQSLAEAMAFVRSLPGWDESCSATSDYQEGNEPNLMPNLVEETA